MCNGNQRQNDAAVSRLRWSKMWWSDWAGDNALSLCSLAAQGLWMRLLCLAAQNEPHGSILIGGRQPTNLELAKLIKPPIKIAQFQKLLGELERRNVAKRKPDGTLFSSRMESDWELTWRQSSKGKKSWESRKIKGVSGSAVRTDNVVRFKPDAEADERRRTPQSPRRSRPTKAKQVGNGMCEVLATDLAAKGGDE
jgi:hypothetical protein